MARAGGAAARGRALAATLGLVVALVAGQSFAASEETQGTRALAPQVRTWKIRYRTHDGHRAWAYVVLPADYGPGRNGRLPLVISPHGRGVDGAANARSWRSLPALGSFALVSPDGHGRRVRLYSWGYRGQVADLARMPRIVTRALPWLRIDRRRIYAVGTSMGGQETLLLLSRYPRRLAGAVAFDPVADLARRYTDFRRLACGARCRRAWTAPIGVGLRALVHREVGGSPRRLPRAYAWRSPLTYARTIASAGVPLQIWWSRKDRTVAFGARHAGRLVRRLRRLNRSAPVREVVGAWPHGAEMRARWGLPYALAQLDLLPPMFTQRVQHGAPAGFAPVVTPPDGDPGAAVEDEILFVRQPASGGRWEIAALGSGGSPARTLATLDGPLHAASWSPDGSRLAYRGRKDETLVVADLTTASSIAVSPVVHHAFDAIAAWSPDSRKIAYVGVYGVNSVGADGASRRRIALYRDEVDPAWSPDGSRMAFTRLRWPPGSFAPVHGRLVITRADIRQHRLLLGPTASVPVGATFSPDGTRIAAANLRGKGVTVVSVDGRDPVVKLARCCPARRVAWWPDGTRIAFLNGESEHGAFGGIVDVATGRVTTLRPRAWVPRFARGPAWAPDGTALAFVACEPIRGGACGLYAAGREGRDFVRLARVCSECGRAGLVAPGWIGRGASLGG